MPAKRKRKKSKPLSDKQRAADDALRAQLENFDLKKFDMLLGKAISLPKRP